MKTLILVCALVCASYAFHHPVSKGEKLCTFCVSLINGIEHFLKNDEGPIEEYANKLCDLLTKDDRLLDPICKGLLDNELTNIIDWLNNNEKPADICTKLHLCTAPKN